MAKIPIVVICGPTASGKTAIAVEMAKRFDGEVVSADSMQIYRNMDIATAKPSPAEMDGVRHHLIDFQSPREAFSVADYVKLATEAIRDITDRGKLSILAGGTGLYISSLVDNIQFDDTGSDMAFRSKMKQLAQEYGNEFLLEKLREIDPETAERLHPNNLSRVIRALEVHHISGKKMSDVQRESRAVPSDYTPIFIGVNYSDREVLYRRIDRRVDAMLENGLLEEAAAFFADTDYPTAIQAIGYKELKPYIDGIEDLDICIDRLKQETRRYAKRQLTWFRKDDRIHWLNLDENDEKVKICEKVEKIIKTYGI